MGIKNQKGTVAVSKYRNTIRLRWRYAGKRYCMSLFAYSKSNLLQARKVALSIEDDMIKGTFDVSLSKYRYNSSTPNNANLVSQFEDWATTYKNKNCNVDKKYNTVRNMLKRWGNLQPTNIIDKLSKEPLCARTYNERLRMLSNFLDFLVLKGSLQVNFLKAVQPKKVDNTKRQERKPFTEQEIASILDAFKHDSFSRNPVYKHSHYFPFVYFIFQTGVRNAEAVGLRVKHVDLAKGNIHIKEALARTLKGTNAAARVRKETKNGKQRMLPLMEDLKEVLLPLLHGKKPDDLVFMSPKGNAIDDNQFQKRIFSKVLLELGIEHRNLYACRHTFGSRCIHEGLTPVMTAFLMGNNPQTALRNYVHLMELPKELPRISSKGN